MGRERSREPDVVGEKARPTNDPRRQVSIIIITPPPKRARARTF